MARRSPGPDTSQSRLASPRARAAEIRRDKSSGDLEQKCFEFDRQIVAGVLGTLRGAIKQGATQLEMVAAERMFDQPLSGTFSRTVQHLHRMVRNLEKLLDHVQSARRYPKAPIDQPMARAVMRRLPRRES